jgi:hypothetical protein
MYSNYKKLSRKTPGPRKGKNLNENRLLAALFLAVGVLGGCTGKTGDTMEKEDEKLNAVEWLWIADRKRHEREFVPHLALFEAGDSAAASALLAQVRAEVLWQAGEKPQLEGAERYRDSSRGIDVGWHLTRLDGALARIAAGGDWRDAPAVLDALNVLFLRDCCALSPGYWADRAASELYVSQQTCRMAGYKTGYMDEPEFQPYEGSCYGVPGFQVSGGYLGGRYEFHLPPCHPPTWASCTQS